MPSVRSCRAAVIGAGASGLMAARRLTENGVPAVALEGCPKPGKKLLATGNGRCNLTNMDISPEKYHGDGSAWELLREWPAERVLSEFRAMGLLTRMDGEGRVYPRGNQAAAVLKALAEGVDIVTGFEAASVTRVDGKFLITSKDGEKVEAEKLVLACGGMAAPSMASGAPGYDIARSLGHTVSKLSPSLVPVRTSSKIPGSLKGMRVKARASLLENGREVCGESGEVIFGNGQLSGICVFDLSARLVGLGGGAEISLDLFEEMELDEIESYVNQIAASNPAMPASHLFHGALNIRVGEELVRAAGIDGSAPVSALKDEDISRLARLSKGWRFPVTGTAGWRDAQVTSGGVPLSEVDLATMGSRLVPGLYLAGEVLNVDGSCGGYNLHWAWATGATAAEGILKSMKKAL